MAKDNKNNTGIENSGLHLLDEDFQHLATATIDTSTGYAVKRIDGVLHKVHRLVVGATSGEIVDHINRNKLDNRRKNLRIVTKSQNNRNRDIKGYTKVGDNRYQVKVTIANKTYYIGTYQNKHDAHVAYKASARLADTINIEGKEYTLSEIKKALGK
jgi:hypothetical protein